MSDVNPYIEGRKKEIELNKRIKMVENDIESIKRDLEAKKEMLIESRKNHVDSYQEQIDNIKKSCTHKQEDGTIATSLTHKDILVPVDGGYKKQHFCELCGAKFDGGFIEVKAKQEMSNDFISYINQNITGDMELFSDNLVFDPDFDSNNFLSTTMSYFSALGLTGKGKKRL